MRGGIILLGSIGLALPIACGQPLSIAGAPCPCPTAAFVCNESTNRCVPAGTDPGARGDGGVDQGSDGVSPPPKTLLRRGETCGAASECETMRCADGICCDRACTGVCETCATSDGVCRPVMTGEDPGTCEAGRACSAGRCGCPAGRELCGSQCAALLDDPGHCGACFHDCRGGRCTDGRCQPDPVPFESVRPPGVADLRARGGYLYFSEPGGLWRVWEEGGPPTLIVRAPAGRSIGHGLAIRLADIFFVVSDGVRLTIQQAPLLSAGETTPVEPWSAIGVIALPFGTAQFTTYFYVVSEPGTPTSVAYLGGARAALPADSRLATDTLVTPVGRPTRYAYFVDRSTAFYALSGGSVPTGTGELWQAPIVGFGETATPIRLSAGRPGLTDDIYVVVADDTHVYFGGARDGPRRVPIGIADGPIELLDQPTDGYTAPASELVQIVIDDTAVFWAHNDLDGERACLRSVVRRQDKALNGSSVVIHEATGRCIKDLTADELMLYWSLGPSYDRTTGEDQIYRVAR